MRNIPGRILGVEVLRPTTKSRADGSAITLHKGDSPGALSYGWIREYSISAESGYTAQPHYTRKTPVETLVGCRTGEVFVVAIDMRSDSPTFGDWQGYYLEELDGRNILIPPGVAWGWQVCSCDAELVVKRNASPGHDKYWLHWDDADLAIDWPHYPSQLADQREDSEAFAELDYDGLPTLDYFTAVEVTDSGKGEVASKGCNLPVSQLAEPGDRVNASEPAGGEPKINYASRSISASETERPILLIGSTGQLGLEFSRTLTKLGKVIGASRDPDRSCLVPVPMQLDVSRPAGLREAIRSVRPSLIVNAAALSDIEVCENQPRMAQLVNATAPAIIAEEAQAVGAGLVHFCTEQVFDGHLDRPYKETDPSAPLNQYARTKLMGTEAILGQAGPHLVIRCGWLYSARGENFLTKLVELCSYRTALTLPSDQLGTPTSTAWLAETLTSILQNANGDYANYLSEFSGLYHLAMLGYANRVEVADWVIAKCRQLSMPLTVGQVYSTTLQKMGMPIQVPKNCQLDSSRFAMRFQTQLQRWQDELDSQVAILAEDRLAMSRAS